MAFYTPGNETRRAEIIIQSIARGALGAHSEILLTVHTLRREATSTCERVGVKALPLSALAHHGGCIELPTPVAGRTLSIGAYPAPEGTGLAPGFEADTLEREALHTKSAVEAV